MTWLRALGRFFERKVGLHRLGVIVSIIIVAIAAVVCFIASCITSISARFSPRWRRSSTATSRCPRCSSRWDTSPSHSTTGSLLSTIGRKDVPYRIAALAGFTSYAIRPQRRRQRFHRRRGALSHLFGLGPRCDRGSPSSASSPADVLARQHHRAGDSASFIIPPPQPTSTSFRSGPIACLAWGALTILVAYIVWVWCTPRVIGRQNWEVRLPNGPLTILQIVIGMIDLSCCALANVHAGPERAAHPVSSTWR